MSDNNTSRTKPSSDGTGKPKKVKKNNLRSKTFDGCFQQCISCGVVVENGEYCDGKSCKFDSLKRSNSISYNDNK